MPELHTFLVVPAYKDGGDEWQAFVRAATAADACMLMVTEEMIETDIEPTRFDPAPFSDSGTTYWTAFQLPDAMPDRPGVVDWDSCIRTNHRPVK